jgi:hypothetical protein
MLARRLLVGIDSLRTAILGDGSGDDGGPEPLRCLGFGLKLIGVDEVNKGADQAEVNGHQNQA